ncbi:hypothetical protein GCM10009788_13940 [Nocardioides humi]|uniref:Uncharacterized protein n=1 Tax=Nocardioides humi TaxID=449461 RepID=A0ABN2A4D6_9ACTN
MDNQGPGKGLIPIEGVVGSEAAGFEQASGDVVGQVAEPKSTAAEAFEAAVEGFGGSVGCAGAVEVGEHVGGALLQRFNVRPSLVTSTSDLGTPVLTDSI